MRWLRKSLLSILVVFTLLHGLANASQQKRLDDQHQAKASKQADDTQNKQPIVAPPAAYYARIFDSLRVIADEQAAKRKQDRADHEDWNTPPFWVSCALVVVGVAYTVFAGKQWVSIKEQARIANDALIETKTSAHAAIQAAEAAQESAKSARRALNANRPYLMAINESLQNFGAAPAKDTKIQVAFMFKNCGKSPAIISTIHARLAVTKTPHPLSSDSPIAVEAFPQWGGVDMYRAIGWIDKVENILAPDEVSSRFFLVALDTSSHPDVAPGMLKPELREGIDRNALLLVLHGVVTYSDIFQQEYATEFIGYLKRRATHGGLRFNLDFRERESRAKT
jgi:hypothetical protein